MRFTSEQIRQIHQDTKTQFRVPKFNNQCAYKPDKCYTVPGTRTDTRPDGLQLTPTTIHAERLRDITLDDAKREGHKTRSEFFQAWAAANTNNRLDPNCEGIDLTVWVITFKRGDWTDTPRLLAGSMTRSNYTTVPALAADGEGEALTPYVQQLYTNEARVRDTLRLGGTVDASIRRMQNELTELRKLTGSRANEKRITAIERILHSMRQAA